MPAVFPILLGWLFTVATCYATGVLVLSQARTGLYREERHFFRFIAGAGGFSLLVFFLTAFHLAYQGVFVLTGAVLILLAFRFRAAPAAVPLPDFPWIWKLVFTAALIAFGVYYFFHALAPEVSPDGATYHLGIVGRYLRQHSFGRITNDMYANLSEAIEMLFLVAFSLGRHSSAALIEFTFLLALPWGMLSYARRLGFPKAGVLAALMVYSSPVFGLSGTIAYNDAAGAAILFATFYLLQIWAETRKAAFIPLIGLLAGFCYGAKYTLFLALPCAGLFLIGMLLRSRMPLLRPLLIYSACALILVLPWMAKNYITVSNPFSPFANRLFRNPYITVHFEREYSELMRTREGLTLRNRPLDHIIDGDKTSGLLGPVFLLAPLALLALRFKPGRQLLLAAAVFLIPAYANVETRFLMPMAPFLALALGLALTNVPFGIPIVLTFQLMTSWPGFVSFYSAPYAWRLNGYHPAEAFRLIPEVATLRKRMPAYRIAELLETKTPPDAKIFTYSGPPEAYTSREILVKYESALANMLGELLWTPLLPDFQPIQQLTFTFSPQSLRAVRVIQSAAHPANVWTISEFRLFNGSQELTRQSTWKPTASVNRWDLPFAFDNRVVTRWSTAEAIRPGMFFQVDLPQSTFFDSVVLQSPVEWSNELRLEGETAAGIWKLLQKAPDRQMESVPLNLRAAATAEFKRLGIRYLLIAQEDFGKDDFLLRQKDWGIELLGQSQGSSLYKVL